jgi:hypothetical protein
VLVSSRQLKALGIDTGTWKPAEIEIAALLVSLPLDSETRALLPNPVRPSFDTDPDLVKPTPGDIEPKEVLESYGVTNDIMQGLSGRPASYKFSHSPPTSLDVLHHKVHSAFKAFKVRPAGENRSDAIFIENTRAGFTLRTHTVSVALPRRTSIVAMGPTLSLLPRQWRLRKIWETGGLVTFSPTYILRSPERFAESVKHVRGAPNWATYVVPAVLEWASLSWDEPL